MRNADQPTSYELSTSGYGATDGAQRLLSLPFAVQNVCDSTIIGQSRLCTGSDLIKFEIKNVINHIERNICIDRSTELKKKSRGITYVALTVER